MIEHYRVHLESLDIGREVDWAAEMHVIPIMVAKKAELQEREEPLPTKEELQVRLASCGGRWALG